MAKQVTRAVPHRGSNFNALPSRLLRQAPPAAVAAVNSIVVPLRGAAFLVESATNTSGGWARSASLPPHPPAGEGHAPRTPPTALRDERLSEDPRHERSQVIGQRMPARCIPDPLPSPWGIDIAHDVTQRLELRQSSAHATGTHAGARHDLRALRTGMIKEIPKHTQPGMT